MKNIIILLSILFFTVIYAQNPKINTLNTFEGSNQVKTIIKNTKGNYVLLENTWYFEPEFEDVYSIIIKELTDEGKVIWSRKLEKVNTSEKGIFLIENDKGYSIFTEDGQLIKIDNSGIIYFRKKTGIIMPRNILASSKGGFFLSNTFNKKEDIWIYKLNSEGEIEWEITKDQYKAVYVSIRQKSVNGNYLALVKKKDKSDASNFYIMEFTNYGEIISEKQIPNHIIYQSNKNLDFYQDRSGNYLVSSAEDTSDHEVKYNFSSEDIRLVKLDKDFNVIFNKLYGFAIGNDFYSTYLGKIIESEEGGYLFICEEKFNTTTYFDSSIFKIDENGNVQWYESFHLNKANFIDSLIPMGKNTYMVSIYSEFNPMNYFSETNIFKITDNLNSNFNPLLCPAED